jgi:hypothetical protein
MCIQRRFSLRELRLPVECAFLGEEERHANRFDLGGPNRQAVRVATCVRQRVRPNICEYQRTLFAMFAKFVYDGVPVSRASYGPI